MKKILSLVIAFALVLSAICTLVVSAEGDPYTVEADNDAVDPGDTVVISVIFNNVTVKAAGVKAVVPEGLTFVKGNLVNGTITIGDPDEDDDYVEPVFKTNMTVNEDTGNIDAAGFTYDSAQVINGTVLKLTLTAGENPGTYTVVITVSNEGEEAVEFPVEITINGEVESSEEP
ncbi:MAG: hypothetical protein ILO64_07415, partial [Clostridia bacterium]|nr:hypothetical protein [Clostridia bacterium]